MSTPLPRPVLTARNRLILLRGVLRRLLLHLFRKSYVRGQLARRQGECARCGACCHMIANPCNRLRPRADGSSECWRYMSFRLPNCRIFPIDTRDLADRDLVSPGIPCGYFWPADARR